MNPIAEFSLLSILALWLLLPVGLFLLAGLTGWLKNPLKVNHCWRLAGWALLASMAVSVVMGILLLIQPYTGGDSNRLATLGGRFGLRGHLRHDRVKPTLQ